MSIYDIAMIIIFLGAIWFGFWKGLSWQIASLASIFLSYFVAVTFPHVIAQYISAEAPWNRFAAMLILFVGTSLVVWTIFASISKSIKQLELKSFDRQAGALLGAFKGATLCMVATMFIVSLMGDRARDTIHDSKTGYYVVSGINQFSSIAPEGLNQYLQPYIEDFQNDILDPNGNLPMRKPIFEDSSGGQSSFVNGSFQNIGNPNTPPAGQPNTWPAQQASWQNQNQFQSQPQPQTGSWGQTPGQQSATQQPATQWPNQQGQPQAWGQQPAPQPQGQWSPPAQQPQPQSNGGWADQFPKIRQGENGWPDLELKVNSKELLQRGAGAAVEAGRQWIERQ